MIYSIAEIKQKRIAAGITQKALAAVTGLHQSVVARAELNKVVCKVSTLVLLSSGIQVIENNRRMLLTGVIVVDRNNFGNALYKSMLPVLSDLEAGGEYKGNSHHLIQRLCRLIIEETS